MNHVLKKVSGIDFPLYNSGYGDQIVNHFIALIFIQERPIHDVQIVFNNELFIEIQMVGEDFKEP